MSAHELLEPSASPVQQVVCADDRRDQPVALGFWPADKPLPALLTDADMRLVFQLSPKTFANLKSRGRFDRFLPPGPVVTDGARYCGVRVREYVLGQFTHARTFGGKRRPATVSRIPVHAADSRGAAR